MPDETAKHYCSLDDIQSVLQAAGRFDELFDTTRKAVTGLFNNYMRRDLSYEANVTEYFDAGTVARGAPFYLYLGKRNIEEGTVTLTHRRNGGAALPVALTANNLNLANGKITLIGPMSFGPQAIAVSYSGGYKAMTEHPDVMDCPSEIRAAAINQCGWMLRDAINQTSGAKEQERGRGNVTKERTVAGLILTVAAALDPYRKPLMRIL